VCLANFLLTKGTLFWLGITCYFFWQTGVKGCPEMPGFEPRTLRFPAWCHGNLTPNYSFKISSGWIREWIKASISKHLQPFYICRSNVFAWPILWWNFLYLRNWSHELCWQRPGLTCIFMVELNLWGYFEFDISLLGGPNWSYDLCLPSHDKVHFP